MVNWRDELHEDPLPWLLESDGDQPAIRYFTLRDILGRSDSAGEVREAKEAVMTTGPVPVILAAQEPEGYWCKPGPGYNPKYRSTVWSVIFLAQLGADGSDARVAAGCEYILSHSTAAHGALAMNGTPSTFVHCLGGNLAAALTDLGWLDDERLRTALEWQARSVTGQGIADLNSRDVLERYCPRTPGPLFPCGFNGRLPCAWGAVKAMLALSKVPPEVRSDVVQSAIDQGLDFLLGHDPAVADYPFARGKGPSANWFKFGYPVFYITDVLQNLEALAALGKAQDARLSNALELVASKQDARGRWKMEYAYNGQTWADIEQKRQPSKWVTLRALRALKAAYPDSE